MSAYKLYLLIMLPFISIVIFIAHGVAEYEDELRLELCGDMKSIKVQGSPTVIGCIGDDGIMFIPNNQ